MQILRHPPQARRGQRGCVATIGNFDGVHLGHQAIIGELARTAAERRIPAIVMTFEPQPLEFFAPETAPSRLTSLREKCQVLARQGVDCVLCLRFTDALARLAPAEFVDRLLVAAMDARHVIVGDDFRFGRNRVGDYRELSELARGRGFEVSETPTCMLGGARVSSSRIRAALLNGDMQAAATLLGRRYSLIGRVVPGDRRGRGLGFPTANIDLERRTPPLRGVFAVRVLGLDDRTRDGVANIGTRPVFGGARMLLETHLFDFDDDLYGRRMEVEFLCKLRDEQRFASTRELQDQIRRDCDAARAFLGSAAAQDAR
ncbi:MAG: bifunctional riboflavin kinase/FAD synthetase [Gammaproteobacteria bacterium]|nr:bifunctional riboflavin kinase/FAD synthetase [Gammaproteobacteria bacterium]